VARGGIEPPSTPGGRTLDAGILRAKSARARLLAGIQVVRERRKTTDSSLCSVAPETGAGLPACPPSQVALSDLCRSAMPALAPSDFLLPACFPRCLPRPTLECMRERAHFLVCESPGLRSADESGRPLPIVARAQSWPFVRVRRHAARSGPLQSEAR
jgi:hypothetical protein